MFSRFKQEKEKSGAYSFGFPHKERGYIVVVVYPEWNKGMCFGG